MAAFKVISFAGMREATYRWNVICSTSLKVMFELVGYKVDTLSTIFFSELRFIKIYTTLEASWEKTSGSVHHSW